MSRGPYTDAELGIDPRAEERAEERAEVLAYDRAQRRRTGCACFAPGEASGTCPGQENCPMCADDDSEGDGS